MKKIVLYAVLLTVVILALVIFFLHWLTVDPTTPRFVPANGQMVVGSSYSWMSFDFLNPSPFEGGKMWVSVGSRKEYHHFLFDIENRVILGELHNAAPCFFNHDQTKVLCYHRARGDTNTLRKLAMELVARLSFSKKHASHAGEDIETFWLVDLKGNSAKRLGRAYQGAGSGSLFTPSPGFRYGFNRTTGRSGVNELFICDLENNGYRKDSVDGHPIGWWDSQRILVKATNNDLMLYDVETRKIAPFLTLQQLKADYAGAGLTNDPGAANAFFMWNGRENQFYMTQGNKRWSAEESYLVKIGRPDGDLKLLDPHFKFEWSDHLDAGDNYYLYSGRKSGETNSAVYLRDLKTRQIHELVPPDANFAKNFSLPHFYNGEVIYVRSNALWQIRLDGGDNRRLFPPLIK